MRSLPPATGTVCERCGRRLGGAAYELRSGEKRSPRCLRCALTHRPLMARSLVISLIVGTLLTAINQGNVIL